VTVRTPDSAFEPMERRYAATLRLMPYVLLLVALTLYALSQSPPSASLLITVGVTGGAAGWVTWWVTLHPCWTARPGLMGVYFAGLVILAAALAARSPWFAFFIWIGYVQSFQYLAGRWMYAGLAAMAVLEGVAQSGGFHRPTPPVLGMYAVLAAVNGVLVGVFVLLGHKTGEQNEARKVMIADLAEANHRLERTLAENAELQARLVDQATEAGVLKERQRMAREIHDTLAQGLAGMITQLAAAEQACDQPEVARRLFITKRAAQDALAEARRSVRAVQPLALRNARLPEAVAGVAARWSEDSGVTAEVTTTGTTRVLRPEVEVTLLRVTQEALSNVAKHAAASRAWVTLSYMEDEVSLDVRDDGTGFEPRPAPLEPVPPEGGFGLTAMRQRVSEMAGELEIESEPGAGTAVSARVPA
jgi:signal transduction histidine kinase